MNPLTRIAELMLFTSPAHLEAAMNRDSHLPKASDPKPSPLNPDLVLPEDIYSGILWVLFWAVTHFVVYRGFIKPLSHYLIQDPVQQATVSTKQSTSTKSTPASVSAAGLRKRKPSSNDQPAEASEVVVEEEAETPVTLTSVEKERSKLQLALWKLTVYVITVCVGVYTLSTEDWWSTPELYFKGYPHFTNNMMKIYYNIGFGNYAYQLYTIFYEPKQSDFWQMFTHHVCTLAVMGVSYFTSFTRIGAVILLLHDTADPIMEFAKCWLYCKRQMMADIFFAVFALTFLVTRNFIFPYYVISACIPYGVYEDGERMPRGYSKYFWICLSCLWVLQLLNLNWGFLIMQMVVKAVRSGGKVDGDIRDE